MNTKILEKFRLLYKKGKWYFSSFTKYSKRHCLEILILLLTLSGVIIAFKSLNLQKIYEQRQVFPLFQYNYENGVFRVSGDSKTSITKVEWVFQYKAFTENDQWELRKVGHHPTALGYYELRDYLASEIGANTLTQPGKDMVKCNLYLFSEVGIPALVSITYDQYEKQGLLSKDFILITRLDTSIPEAIVQKNGRNIKDPETAKKLFDEYMPWFSSTLDTIKETQNRNCGIIMNQPIEGY